MTIIPITDELISTLKEHQQRTGIGPARLLKGSSDKPAGLTSAIFYNWIRGEAKTAKKEYVEYFLKRYETAPVIVKLPPEIIKTIRSEMNRCGFGGKQLVSLHNTQSTSTISYSDFRRWLGGFVKSARKDQVDSLISFLASCPNKDENPKREYKTVSSGYTPLKDNDLKRIKAYSKQTGVGFTELIETGNNPPEGLKPYTISGWLSRNVKSADANTVRWVIESYEKLSKK